MGRRPSRVPSVLFLLAPIAVVGFGCDGVLERVGLADDPPPVVTPPAEPSEDAKALALAVGSMAAPQAEVVPLPPPSPVIVTNAGLEELELWDVELEWKPSSMGYGYYGGEAADVLNVSAKARTRKPLSAKAQVTMKATCDDGSASISDTDQARVDDHVGVVLPSEGVEFRVGAQLFVKSLIAPPSACRVVVALRDKTKSPSVRGSISLCWTKGSKTPTPCPAPVVETASAWSVEDVQFLPTNELGFAVVAGTAVAPDRLGIRSTCHVGDKHFVEFQYLDARLEALEPGDRQRQHQQLTSAWEYMRFSECDIEIQSVSFDFDEQKILGVTELGRRCMRPAGVREGRCAKSVIEPVPPDPTGPPVVATIQNSSFTSYGGWYGGYAMAELTLRAPLSKDSRFEFRAMCGKKVEKMSITFPTPIELVYPGQSLRAQGSVSGRGRPKPQTCTTEFVLHTKDEVGLDREWSLGTQCYASSGASVPCKGAPPTPTTGGLGLSGTGGFGFKRHH